MKSLGLGFGYFCIYTTPIQLFLLGWILLYIFQTPYGFLDLSSKIFLKQNLEFFTTGFILGFGMHILISGGSFLHLLCLR